MPPRDPRASTNKAVPAATLKFAPASGKLGHSSPRFEH
jgi:hypothetical protein